MSRGTPTVSFLMPVRNAAATLERALGSALAQRGAPELEVVAVDDGSTDGSGERMESLARRDSRLRVVRPGRIGLIPALALGQSLCRGEFIARLDADDIAHPERLTVQLSLMARWERLGLVGSQVRYFPARDTGPGARHYERWLNGLLEGCRPDSPQEALRETATRVEREMFIECPLAHPTFLLRRAALIAAGGYCEFEGLPEDYDLIFRLVETGWKVAGAGRVLHAWREHPGRTSRNDSRYSEPSFLRLKLHHLLRLHLDCGARPVSICGAGPVGKTWLKALKAAGVTVRYLIEVNPRRLGKIIHGVPVVRAGELKGPHDSGLVLGAVGQKGGRDNVRADLDPLGYVEGRDYLLVS